MKSLFKPVVEAGGPIFDVVKTLPPVLSAVGIDNWVSLVVADTESTYSSHSCSAPACTDAIHFLVKGSKDVASAGEPYRSAKAFFRYSKPAGPLMSGSTSLMRALLISVFRICQQTTTIIKDGKRREEWHVENKNRGKHLHYVITNLSGLRN